MRVLEIVAVLLACVAWVAAPAFAVFESEPNDTVEDADVVLFPDVAEGIRADNSDVDIFRFTGLVPDETYQAFTGAILLGLGWVDNDGFLIDSVAFQGLGLELSVVADESGEVVLKICGHVGEAFDCTAESMGAGPYTLSVPEPTAGQLALTSLSILALLHQGSRARRLR
jgi:hypothetical protein